MGLNAEMVRILVELRPQLGFGGLSVIELGAQDLCAAPEVVDHILAQGGVGTVSGAIVTARALYERLGYSRYECIDATDLHGARIFDLNCNVAQEYGFTDQFDVVTNLGTAEHCFNQYEVFRNIHEMCKVGGYIIHAAPCAGNVNHGFFNYHPRFFADLAAANKYRIVRLAFTVDYQPNLIEYSLEQFKRYDNRDLLFYAVLQRVSDDVFRTPFDGMFASENALQSYASSTGDPLFTTFAPYLKGGDWSGTRGHAVLPWWKRGRAGRLLAGLSRR